MAFEFQPWPKIPRLMRDTVMTEKIDGTNAAVIITEDGRVGAQSRKRVITPEDDNFGFAAWVAENAEALAYTLGPGYHFGEWWGHGIQRGYGLQKGDRRFSLFNIHRWGHFTDPEQAPNIPGLVVVPMLHTGQFDTLAASHALSALAETGSHAAPGYMRPEGIVVQHVPSRQLFKLTFDDGNKEAA